MIDIGLPCSVTAWLHSLQPVNTIRTGVPCILLIAKKYHMRASSSEACSVRYTV